MALVKRFRRAAFARNSGQVTVELVVAIPVLLIVAVVGVNALLFLGECASFDRQARDAIRVHAAAPGYGQGPGDAASAVQAALSESFNREFEQVRVSVSGASPGLVRYEATLSFTPTLVGRSFSGTVFGTWLSPLEHTTVLVVDPYKPGAIV